MNSFQLLDTEILEKNKCSGCAACVVSCPQNALNYQEGKPFKTKDCDDCGICLEVCPAYNNNITYDQNDYTKMGFEIGSCQKSDSFGLHEQLIVCRSNEHSILDRCQDGGLVSSILCWGTENKWFDGAIVAGRKADNKLFPEPSLATTGEEILRAAGSCYTYSPNLICLKGEESKDYERLALVGTPCQIAAFRLMQKKSLNKVVKRVALTIGLFCSKSFEDELINTKICSEMGIGKEDIIKFDIKGNFIITLKTGDTIKIPLKEINQYTRKGCLSCTDFSATLADISVGGIGANGWTVTVVRTNKGAKVIEALKDANKISIRAIEDYPVSKDLLNKLSLKKKKPVIN